MAKPELGTKRICGHCGTKFFDLHKNPITCPKCETVFQPTYFARGSARPINTVKEESELNLEDLDTISLEDVDLDGDKSDDDDLPGGDEDDTFLEEEEGDADDVTSLIDGEIETEEEN